MKNASDGGDPPQERGAPAAEVADRVAERAEQEARIRQGDDEPVVPAKRLEELSFLDYCFSHSQPPVERRSARPARGATL